MLCRSCAPALLATLAFGAPLLAQATPLLPYQGRLEQGGAAVNGPYDFRFGLFAAEGADAGCLDETAPGSCGIWWEEQGPVPVFGGAFAVLLGSGSPLSQADLARPELWLAIAVRVHKDSNPDAFTLLGRKQRLADVPSAATAGDFDVTGALVVQGAATVQQDLTVGGTLRVVDKLTAGQDSSADAPALAFAQQAGDEANAGKISYRPSWDRGVLGIIGAGTGSSRRVRVWDTLMVNGDLEATSNQRSACAWTTTQNKAAAEPNWAELTCPDDKFMAGIRFTHNAAENYTYQERFQLYCCEL